MVGVIWPDGRFERAVTIFFVLVLLALGVATFVNAPLSYDGAYFFFRVLDARRFAYDYARLINIPLQVPVLIAMHFTQDVGVLSLIFSAAYCSIPALGLAVAWLVCKRRQSLFIWPILSICIASLPGRFFFSNEQIMVATLLWPALLTGLVGASVGVLSLVAILAIIATLSQPMAVPILAVAALIAVLTGISRPRARMESLLFALFLGLLIAVRAAIPLYEWELHSLSSQVVINSFFNAVFGWPLVAIVLTLIAALGCVVPVQRRAWIYPVLPLILAGVALVAWAINPANWASSLDYRYWVSPLTLLLMAAAAFDELVPQRSTETERQSSRLYAVPLVGTIFLVVLSIQSVEWGLMSQRLHQDLADSDHGCVTWISLDWLRDNAFGHWGTTFYAVELQGRKPSTLLLPAQLACQQFALNGDATLVDLPKWTVVRHAGKGWFDFDDALRKARLPQKFFDDSSKTVP